MDLLTHTVNVPAEREKLRRLRDEINADAEKRLAHQRRYTARGFLRDMQPLDAQKQIGHRGNQDDGKSQTSTLRTRPSVDLPAAAADVREATACVCCRCGGAVGLGGEGVKA